MPHFITLLQEEYFSTKTQKRGIYKLKVHFFANLTFFSQSISFYCVPTNELIVVKYISIFENKKFQKHSILYTKQQQKKGLKKAFFWLKKIFFLAFALKKTALDGRITQFYYSKNRC